MVRRVFPFQQGRLDPVVRSALVRCRAIATPSMECLAIPQGNSCGVVVARLCLSCIRRDVGTEP